MGLTLSTCHTDTSAVCPTRDEALRRLNAFLPKVPLYAQGRNFDLPEHQAVSELSPFLRYRLIPEREVIRAVLNAHPYEVAEKFIQEVCWRTYFKGYLELRPGIWERYKAELQSLIDDPGKADVQRFAMARAGETGIECFDDWVQQLVTTGWLHNHARMWFASIWIFTLRLPWQAGAAFFLEHLLDGDVASNTLSWRWVAGLHTRGKHYLARAENINRYTGGRYNPVGLLNETADALPPDGTFESVPFAKVALLKDVHLPSLSCCPAGLLVHPADLTPESGELSETPFSSICVLSATDVMESFGASEKVRAFCSGAVADSAIRLADHWDGKVIECQRQVIPMVGKASPDNVGRRERMRVYGGTVDKWIDGVITWARNEHLKSIWYLRPPVGPWGDAMEALKEVLNAHDIRVFEYRRRWDSLHWPHATSGYFRFKDGLKERLERLP
jgi:deoxyribodipyrimidine photo-lyase